MRDERSSNSPLAVITVYLAGFLQGLTLVSFPASSAVLKQMHGFSDAQYGAIFLPQVALAIIGAVGGGALARRLGLKTLLAGALLANAASQWLLAATALLGPRLAFEAILFGTACLGFGFGAAGAPLNSYPAVFFPEKRETAIIALHTALGLGLMMGPLLAGGFIAWDHWAGFPLALGGLSLLLMLAVVGIKLPRCELPAASQLPRDPAGKPPLTVASFWLFFAMTVLYAFAEGTFSNWIVVYLQEIKRLPMAVASLSLSVFWAALVMGRLLVSVAVLRIPAERIWLALPLLMIGTFLLLPYATSASRGIGLFALAGLACSAFFPLSIGLVAKRFPQHTAWVSSMLIAALMVGVGMGSFLIGLLRELLPLEKLYQFSSLYPLWVLMLAAWLARTGPPRCAADSFNKERAMK